ncbi:DUF2244 domain-containing protein [Oceanicella sp. SM1341]|uniref:DUF2244 domain-containing protein n=1 Tax=Oceanicella sp. SM1341 TaxID=1548889 RepID=UPI000E511F90|nr:DUF2244 domain-containing protein [Oceanicella sp. SM1341]
MVDTTRNIPAGAPGAPAPPERDGAPQYTVTLWPHRSLSQRGFHLLILLTSLVYLVPLTALVGTRALWVMLPFAGLHVGLLWLFMRRNYRDARITEEVKLWPDLMTVERRDPGGRVRHWHANPYWVRLEIAREGRPENYLTLTGNGRRIELGAFLSPEERLTLHDELSLAIARSRATPRA